MLIDIRKTKKINKVLVLCEKNMYFIASKNDKIIQ